jgi:hypothetical protein
LSCRALIGQSAQLWFSIILLNFETFGFQVAVISAADGSEAQDAIVGVGHALIFEWNFAVKTDARLSCSRGTAALALKMCWC